MSTLRISFVLSLLTLAAACGSSYSSSPTSPAMNPPATPPTSSGGGATVTASIAIPSGAAGLGDRAFPPNPLTVDAGTTVTWTNTDSVAHTSTSNTAVWDSGIVAPGGHFDVAFNTPGTFQYHCAIHPGMVGTVVVR